LTPPRPCPGPRRRTLFASAAGAAAALLAACSSPGRPDAARTPSADDRALTRAAEESTELAAVYDAVLAAHPGLVARLTPLRDAVLRHAEVCARHAGPAASPSPSGTSSAKPSGAPSTATSGQPAGTVSGSPAPPGPAVPGDEKEALGSLADAERELSARRTRELSGLGGGTARLLASVAAAGAVHAYLLKNG
jgi:hypothetical protein